MSVSLVAFIVLLLSTAASSFRTDGTSQHSYFGNAHISRASARAKLLKAVPSELLSGPMPCPCADASLCAPLATPLPEKESFAFQVVANNWPFYDWSRLTSIVLYDGMDPAMLCMAHARGVRIIWAASFSASDLLNETAKSTFLADTISRVVSTYADGVNFDFEDPVEPDTPEYSALTDLTAALSSRLKAAVPTSSMSFDVAWSAQHIDVRYYNYSALSAVCDFLVIMDYDTRSQVFSGPPCLAGPNSPIETATDGIRSFLDLPGIPPNKLVLGEPWYGYIYPCHNSTELTSESCTIRSVPFRGVACSDAAGSQWNYAYIMQYLRNATTQRFTPVVVNTTAAPGGSYVHATVNGSLLFPPATYDTNAIPIAGIYFDNPATLRQKYAVAKAWGLRGVSMWNMDAVSFAAEDVEETREMWESLDAFLH